MSIKLNLVFFKKYLLIPLVIIAIFMGWFGYLEYNYRVNNNENIVLEKFIKDLDNEKVDSKLISMDFFGRYENKENLEEIKKLNQENDLKIGNVKLAPSGKTATADIDYRQNPEKTSVIYLEKKGNWYLKGYYWQVYRVENFEVGLLESVEKQMEELVNNVIKDFENIFK